jgi:hypothetical protein
MAGKHAEEDMGAHPWGEPVVDRAQVQIDGLLSRGDQDERAATIRMRIRRRSIGMIVAG